MINETILGPEDQKVTDTPLFFFLVQSQRRTRELCAAKPYLFQAYYLQMVVGKELIADRYI